MIFLFPGGKLWYSIDALLAQVARTGGEQKGKRSAWWRLRRRKKPNWTAIPFLSQLFFFLFPLCLSLSFSLLLSSSLCFFHSFSLLLSSSLCFSHSFSLLFSSSLCYSFSLSFSFCHSHYLSLSPYVLGHLYYPSLFLCHSLCVILFLFLLHSPSFSFLHTIFLSFLLSNTWTN